ncbi:MAG TPA: hypothetical protein VF584_14145 [Longimicrobium sp.]|jgi:hypothetical protein
MTRFMKESLTRALCAAFWCIPGGLWLAAPAVAGELNDSWVIALPHDGFICGNREPLAYELRRSLAMSAAFESGEYTDSLVSRAGNPGMSAKSRRRARELLAATGQPRALRYLAAHPPPHELPPIVVHPAP